MAHDQSMIEARGQIEVMPGPMFAGKNEELLGRVHPGRIPPDFLVQDRR
jgi:hypothetical protein